MANERILVVEDDKDLNEIICGYLAKENYMVKKAFDGSTGIQMAKEFSPELVLLDIMLPKTDGAEVCRVIRTFSNVPIMIISAKSEDIDKLLLLGLGADDYLTKPFSLVELGARVRSHLRRFTSLGSAINCSASIDTKRVFGDIVIDTTCHKVTVCGNDVELTSKEFKLLDYFSKHPSQVFSKEQLIDNVWGYTEYIDLNTITVYIGRLREKLSAYGPCYIKTVWGVGYKWEI